MKAARRGALLVAVLAGLVAGASCGGSDGDAAKGIETPADTQSDFGPAFTTISTEDDGNGDTGNGETETNGGDSGDDDGEASTTNDVTVGPAFADPRVVDFGRQAVGTEGEPQRIRVRNGQSEPVSITSVEIGGDAPNDFLVRETTCVPGLELPRDATCEVAIVFRPTESGERAALLLIVVSGGSGRQIRLAGSRSLTDDARRDPGASTTRSP
jgi:hypothetical protein